MYNRIVYPTMYMTIFAQMLFIVAAAYIVLLLGGIIN